jgi:hypothetical protein
LPKLYAAMSRRMGWPWVYEAMGGWVPAMRVTEHGAPADVKPYDAPGLMRIIFEGTSRRLSYTTPPIKRRLRLRKNSARQITERQPEVSR